MIEDNICAIATPYGVAALSVIRVSGENAITLVNKLFKGKNLEKVKPNTINYGYIANNEEIIDEVMVSVFHKPRSYTGENSCEITCHGGIYVTNKVLKTLLDNGFRLAERGEFTKRAFLNQKLDLTASESIMDIIESENDISLKSSLAALKDSLKKAITDLREQIMSLIAEVEVNIDYPEYDEKRELTTSYLITNLKNLLIKMEGILKDSKIKETYQHGLKTVIVGKPNVGKSSILNYLIGYDKAIVSNIAGTTRDLVEGHINLGDFSLNLIDTAGVRTVNDELENLGIERTKKAIKEAELILFVRDVTRDLDEKDAEIKELIKDKKIIYINNKTDEEQVWQEEGLAFSAKENKGLDLLIEKIKEMFNLGEFRPENPTLNNMRQYELFKKAYNALLEAYTAAKSGFDIELLVIDLNNAFTALGEIIGLNYQEELITNLFTKFCLGK